METRAAAIDRLTAEYAEKLAKLPDEHPGVVLHTLGINGARYGTALAWNEEAWLREVARRPPDLVILEYGGNEAGDFEPKYEETGENIERRLNNIIENLEAKSRELGRKVKDDVLPQAEATVRENLWVSILTALGLGLILGLVLGLSGRR